MYPMKVVIVGVVNVLIHFLLNGVKAGSQ